MDKMLVKIIKLSSLLAIIIILAIVALVHFIDPNDYKDNISKVVNHYTGRNLTIGGKIQFSIFPNISLQLQDITLSNSHNFAGNFIAVKNTKIKLRLIPLLTKQLSVKGFELDGIIVNLETDKHGNTNYKDLLNKQASATTASLANKNLHDHNQQHKSTAKNTTDYDNENKSLQMPNLQISELVIKHGTVTWNNQQNNNNFKLADFSMIAEGLDLTSSKNLPPISISGKIINLANSSQELTFDTEVILNPGNQIVKLNPLTLTAYGIKTKIVVDAKDIMTNLALTGNLAVPAFSPSSAFKNKSLPQNAALQSNLAFKNDMLSINQINATIDNASINGDFSLTLKDEKSINFNLSTNNLNLERLGMLLGAMTTSVNHNPEPTTKAGLIPTDALKDLNMKGTINSNNIYVTNAIKLDQLNANLVAHKGLIQASPITAKFADSEHNATAALNVSSPTPSIDITSKAHEFRIEKLIAAIGQKESIAGNTAYSLALRVVGNTIPEFKNSLSGFANMQISDGFVYGVNIQDSLDTAKSGAKELYGLVKDKQGFNIENLVITNLGKFKVKSEPNPRTPFDKLTVNNQIQNGIAHSDFSLQHKDYAVTGSGKINIPQDSINYVAEAKLSEANMNPNDDLDKLLYKYPLEINISGPIEHPKITPNIPKFLTAVLKDRQQSLIKSLTDKVMNKVLGTTNNTNSTGSTDSSSTSTDGAPNNTHESVESKAVKKINKALGGILKGI